VEHLFKVWADFLGDCRAASHVLFLSDYDGTLTPIVGRPVDAVLSPDIRDKLARLARQPAFSVGVISGRAISELKSMVGIEGIYYAGNHGLEIEGPGISYITPEAGTSRAVMRELAGQIAAALADTDGVIIQDKGLSISVHYRLVAKGEERRVTDTVHRLTTVPCNEGKIRVFAGKKVWEIRPPVDWDKGRAVKTIAGEIKKIRQRENLLTVFLGDDVTDEDAFKVVRRPEGWSVYVGPDTATSAAGYCLNSTEEVGTLLTRLTELELT
jgi:trehalose 6-phosphate phosphatase